VVQTNLFARRQSSEQIPTDAPIQRAETIRVTIRGYLLGAHFERDGDHDMQAELAAGPEWNTDLVLLELAPGAEYCEARQGLWQLVRKDGCKSILRKPVEVLVTGYLLVGGAQAQKITARRRAHAACPKAVKEA
jgi:hypothetical protein